MLAENVEIGLSVYYSGSKNVENYFSFFDLKFVVNNG